MRGALVDCWRSGISPGLHRSTCSLKLAPAVGERRACSGDTMATSQKVVVFVDPTTLAALKDLGYALYALKGFQTTNAQGKALVWGETTAFADTTTFISTAEYQAFVTTSVEIGGGGVITSSAVADVT